MRVSCMNPETESQFREWIKEVESTTPQKLSTSIKAAILKDIINRDCNITVTLTDHEKKMMWVEFTWNWEDNDENHS